MVPPIEVYRWQEDPGDGILWAAQQVDTPQVNATCAERYETDQVNTPRLLEYITQAHNDFFQPDPKVPKTDFVFVEPPPGWSPIQPDNPLP